MCTEWHEKRAGRLTASTFGKILLRQTVTDKFITHLTSNQKFSAAATRYGLANESNAKKQYIADHPDVHMHDVGLVVNPCYPFLGASPDARVCKDGVMGIVEIKCPYSARDMVLADACQQLKAKFCLRPTADGYDLHTNHEYWFQVQGQLLVTGAPFCLFIVYTRREMWHNVIQPDNEVMSTMLEKLSKFYNQYIYLPQITDTRHTIIVQQDDDMELEMDAADDETVMDIINEE